MKTLKVNVDHVTRVEGHGNIVVNVKEGKIEECKWEVVEAPRFFEAFVRGRSYLEVARTGRQGMSALRAGRDSAWDAGSGDPAYKATRSLL